MRLCEQPINLEHVIGRLRARLRERQEIVSTRKEARDYLRRAQEHVRSTLRLATDSTDALRRVYGESGAVKLDSLSKRLQEINGALQRDVREIDPAELRALAAALDHHGAPNQNLDLLLAELRQALQDLPSQDKAREILGLRQQLLDIARIWTEYVANRLALRGAILLADNTEHAFRHCQNARKEIVQSLFDELSADIDRIYMQFHPQESHGGIHLEVREAVQGSVNLRGTFYDRPDEDLRAYYSDAHLDTLGLSIFLALRRWHRKNHPQFDLLVIDDVLTSVDSQHLVRVSEFLLKEFGDYQILLTTHDRIWFEHLRDIQSRCRVSNRFINKIIHKWTIQDGPDLREPEDERADLGTLLQDGEARDIAGLGGRLLEHVLQEMRYSFGLSIEARRSERYEIGDLWPAFLSEIRKNYPSLYQTAKSTLESLDVRWPLRNWVGAHFNEWAGRESRQASAEFGKAVCDLFDYVFCSECRRFVEPSSTPLGQVACRCGAKLYAAQGKQGIKPRPRSEVVAETRAILRDAKLDTSVYLEMKETEGRTED